MEKAGPQFSFLAIEFDPRLIADEIALNHRLAQFNLGPFRVRKYRHFNLTIAKSSSREDQSMLHSSHSDWGGRVHIAAIFTHNCC